MAIKIEEIKNNMRLIEILENNNYCLGRIISPSKSDYVINNPKSVVVFNANLVTENEGNFWYGDIDITKDGKKLKQIASELNTVFYIFRESDLGIENDYLPIEYLKKAVWDTTKQILIK